MYDHVMRWWGITCRAKVLRSKQPLFVFDWLSNVAVSIDVVQIGAGRTDEADGADGRTGRTEWSEGSGDHVT